MAEGQPGGRPWWQWILIALLIIGIIYLIFSLFALGRNQPQIGLTTPTPEAEEMTEEPTPTTEPSPSSKPATVTPTHPLSTTNPSPTGTIQQTPQTGP